MTLAILSAFFCVFSRALLSVLDRLVFKQEKTDFVKSLAMNAFFPFLISLLISYVFGEQNPYFFDYILQPGIVFSAFGAQAAAYVISSSFRKLTVKSVVVSSKIADIFIPLTIFCVTNEFKLSLYIFSCLTTLIFIPILASLIRNKTDFSYLSSMSILGVLVFQATINSYFSMNKFADTWPKFLSMISCILLWRAIFMLVHLLIQQLNTPAEAALNTNKEVRYLPLFFRAFLAFASQAAFFYSIAGMFSAIVWPILNTAPLVTGFSAHFFLNEKVGLLDMAVMGMFIVVLFFYLLLQGIII